jgi:hypothetical protein
VVGLLQPPEGPVSIHSPCLITVGLWSGDATSRCGPAIGLLNTWSSSLHRHPPGGGRGKPAQDLATGCRTVWRPWRRERPGVSEVSRFVYPGT